MKDVCGPQCIVSFFCCFLFSQSPSCYTELIPSQQTFQICLLGSHFNILIRFFIMYVFDNKLVAVPNSSIVYHTHATHSLFSSINSQKHIRNSSQGRASRVKHECLHTLYTCVSFSRVQTISSSTVKTLKYCVMLSSAVFLTSCTS